jgi:tetratricopeptide (TPR) repeat protein
MPGLVLRLNYGGTKSWRALYYVPTIAGPKSKKAGQRISMPTTHELGRFPVLSVKQAREKAREFLFDPQRSLAQADVGSFKEIAETFVKLHVENPDPKSELRTRDEVVRVLNKYVYPQWQYRPFRDIRRGDYLEVEQPGGRTDQHGQFVLAVDRSQNNLDDLFEQAQSAEEAGDIAEAERLYRILLKSDPTDASAPFNLGNLLRATGRNVEAEAALRAATRADPTFADAWYNLSDLLDEQGRVEAAIECLRTTLRVASEYADAMFNLALLLQWQNQYNEAADYWHRYLASDCQSEWAVRARRSLKFCEMQVHLNLKARGHVR